MAWIHGKPQNGLVESFNSRLRDELLNETLLLTMDRTHGTIDRVKTTMQATRLLARLCHPRGPTPPKSPVLLRDNCLCSPQEEIRWSRHRSLQRLLNHSEPLRTIARQGFPRHGLWWTTCLRRRLN